MKRVTILCEGQTEEQFVNRILRPYFEPQQIYCNPIVLSSKRYASGSREHGGVSTYGKIRRNIINLCCDHNAQITTMLDYYQLPKDTPGIQPVLSDYKAHVKHLEEEMELDISSPNFHANLLVHEFEALLFSNPESFKIIADNRTVLKLKEIREQFDTPEDINSSVQSAPSKRILEIKPDYRKVSQGVELAEDIGLNCMVSSCPHFAEWIQWIKN